MSRKGKGLDVSEPRLDAEMADPLQEQMVATERLARLVVGDDDERFALVFASLVNLIDGFEARPAEEQLLHARSILMRSAEPYLARDLARGKPARRAAVGIAPGPPVDSVFSDPVFLENVKTLIADR